MTKIGILNSGKNNRFEDCSFSENLDIGIKDEGKGTVAIRNTFGDKVKGSADSVVRATSYVAIPLVTTFYKVFCAIARGLWQLFNLFMTKTLNHVVDIVAKHVALTIVIVLGAFVIALLR